MLAFAKCVTAQDKSPILIIEATDLSSTPHIYPTTQNGLPTLRKYSRLERRGQHAEDKMRDDWVSVFAQSGLSV